MRSRDIILLLKQSEQELVFVKSQIAQLGKEVEKINNCEFTVCIINMA